MLILNESVAIVSLEAFYRKLFFKFDCFLQCVRLELDCVKDYQSICLRRMKDLLGPNHPILASTAFKHTSSMQLQTHD